MNDKETGEFHVFSQAKNTAILGKTFKHAIKNFEKKEEKRESTMEAIQKFKEIVKNTIKEGCFFCGFLFSEKGIEVEKGVIFWYTVMKLLKRIQN